jgi:hypothetical protein
MTLAVALLNGTAQRWHRQARRICVMLNLAIGAEVTHVPYPDQSDRNDGGMTAACL